MNKAPKTFKSKTPVAAVAKGSTRKMPKDNLTLDVLDAEAAGMTYGKYKAMHPRTKEDNEARLGKVHTAPPKPKRLYDRVCEYCGQPFTAEFKNKKYCSKTCKGRKGQRDYVARHKNAKKEEKKDD